MFGIEQAVVHVDVNHRRAIIDLLAGNLQRLVVVLHADEPQELLAAGHVAPLAHDEAQADVRAVFLADGLLQSGQMQPATRHYRVAAGLFEVA